jgi:DNA-binding transcriptional regulator YdaS (Cro superfamily)
MSDHRSTTGPPLDIRAAGEELLGERWQQPLAYMLGLNPRTVQRWANGQNAVPPGIAARIGDLLAIVRQVRSEAAADRERRNQAAE